MHYSNLVIIDAPDAGEPLDLDYITSAVESAMGPSEDQGGFWDWYQIGGRWTGTLDGYDPETDPALQEPCDYCEATGTTTAAVAVRYPAYLPHVGNACIQCRGKGQRTVWPTQWPTRAGDCVPLAQVTEEQYAQFYRVIVDGRPYEKEAYEPWHEKLEDKFPARALPPLAWLKQEYPTALAVVVDNHS